MMLVRPKGAFRMQERSSRASMYNTARCFSMSPIKSKSAEVHDDVPPQGQPKRPEATTELPARPRLRCKDPQHTHISHAVFQTAVSVTRVRSSLHDFLWA